MSRFVAIALVPLPSACKVFLYRHLLRYKIGHRVRIGFSAIDASECTIGDDVVIGHGNLLVSIDHVTIGSRTRIGHLNIIRGGEVSIGSYVEILRLNELNAIPLPPTILSRSILTIGDRAVITTGHKIDFTASVTIGNDVIIAGRNSSLWTHTLGLCESITIGQQVYLGSEVRMAPGSSVPSRSVVGIGSVIVDPLDPSEGYFFAGVPARRKRALTEKDAFLLRTASFDSR